MNNTLQKVAAYLDKNEIRYFFDDETATIQLWRIGQYAQFRVQISVAMNDTGLNCHSMFPLMTPEAARPAMAMRLAKLNYGLAWGSFEMDPSDGEVRFRTAIPVSKGAISNNYLDCLIQIPVIILDQHVGELMEICGNMKTNTGGSENTTSEEVCRYERN
jgi:hypothetical protein